MCAWHVVVKRLSYLWISEQQTECMCVREFFASVATCVPRMHVAANTCTCSHRRRGWNPRRRPAAGACRGRQGGRSRGRREEACKQPTCNVQHTRCNTQHSTTNMQHTRYNTNTYTNTQRTSKHETDRQGPGEVLLRVGSWDRYTATYYCDCPPPPSPDTRPIADYDDSSPPLPFQAQNKKTQSMADRQGVLCVRIIHIDQSRLAKTNGLLRRQQRLEISHPDAAAAAAASPADRPAPAEADAPPPRPAMPPPGDPTDPPAPDAELSMNMFTALSREKAFACG